MDVGMCNKNNIKDNISTSMRFELTHSKSNGLAIHRLNHSATMSVASSGPTNNSRTVSIAAELLCLSNHQQTNTSSCTRTIQIMFSYLSTNYVCNFLLDTALIRKYQVIKIPRIDQTHTNDDLTSVLNTNPARNRIVCLFITHRSTPKLIN